ncbi:MAG: hypothetical protein ACJA0X_001238 [Cyclobacteriaceae bacterium]|jgi:hypothetical protein
MNNQLNKIFVVILIFFNIVPLMGQKALERVKVDKNISMKIPVGFRPMSQSDLINRYNAFRKPLAMYTNENRQIDLGINENSSPWAGEDLEILSDFYRANISNLFTEVHFINDEIRAIGDRRFAIFEFTSKVSDESQTFGGGSNPVSKYTYIMYTIRNNKVLLFNFSAPARMRTLWEEAAKEMMESIRIK